VPETVADSVGRFCRPSGFRWQGRAFESVESSHYSRYVTLRGDKGGIVFPGYSHFRLMVKRYSIEEKLYVVDLFPDAELDAWGVDSSFALYVDEELGTVHRQFVLGPGWKTWVTKNGMVKA
jgi:hypothetical protein